MQKLIQNAFYVPEADKFYSSINTHDFTGHVFPDGREYFVDGGLSYRRVVGDFPSLEKEGKIVDYTLYAEDGVAPTQDILDRLLWGTRGVESKGKLTFRPIKELGHSHLRALLDYIPENNIRRKCVEYWLNIYTQK